MNRLCGFLFAFAALLSMGSVAAQAQTGGAKPACATGDTIVWENTSTKAYHLPTDKFYGTTKHGAYACRSAADGAGYHLAGGKSTPSTAQDHGKHHHKSGGLASPEPSPAAS